MRYATTRHVSVGWWVVCMLAACSDAQVDLGSGAHAPAGNNDPNLHPGLLPMADAPSGSPVPLSPSTLPPPPLPPEPLGLGAAISAEVAPPPISGGTLTVADDGSQAIVADPDRDAVYVVDLADQRIRTVMLAQGSEPGRVVLDGAGNAQVALRGAGTLARIDTANAKLERTTPVCALPRGLAYDAASDGVWVACATGELVSLNATNHTERSRSFVATDLRDVVIDGSGALFVSRFRSAELLQIAADGSIAARQSPLSISVDRQSSPPQAGFATSPTQAWRTIRGPDGAPFMLHQHSRSDAISAASGGWSSNRANAITRPQFTRFDGPAPAQTSMPLSAAVTLPVDIASSPDGRWVAVADPAQYLSGRLSVFVIPMAALAQAASATPSSMSSAAAVPMLDCACDGLLAMAEATQATSVAFDRAGLLYVFGREPAMLDVFSVVATDVGAAIGAALHRMQSIVLGGRSVRDTGHDIFHADVGSGLACASCHAEALDDGHVWDFLEGGKRRTQNLRGGLLSTLPLHWQGEFATFGELVTNVMTGRMGGFVAKDEYKDALGHWLDRQPELPHPSADPAGVARGKQLFESQEVGCTGCHSGAAFTNNQTVDVGTGGAFQVPSLRGVGLRAPLMHDGCAQTLADRFSAGCGGDSRHGNTSQLTAAERADLISYLANL
jgi:DNA-binding beta-propeller fold protein YncE